MEEKWKVSKVDKSRVKIKENMTKKEIRSMVVDLAWPSIAEMTLMSLVGIADMIMVGRLGPDIGPRAISAVGLSNQPLFFAMAIFRAFNVGTTALVARFMGAEEQESANETAKQNLVLVIISSIVIGLLGVLFAERIIIFMGAETDVISMGTIYLRISSIGMIFNMISMGLSAVLRGAGDTRTPMRINMTSNVINVTANYILIYGKLGFPALGVAGAALATSFSRVVSSMWILITVLRGKSIIKISFRDGYQLNKEIVRRILQIGFPASMEQFIVRSGMLFFARIVAGLGTITFAAHQIALNVMSLSFMPGMGLSVAASTLVGMGLGAKKPHIAERSGFEAQKLGIITTSILGLAFILFAPWIVLLYNNNPEVVVKGVLVLRIVGLIQPAQATQFILAGGLRGAGDTKWPLYTSALGIWGVRIILAMYFINQMDLGLAGAWLALSLDQIIRSILIYYRFKSGQWKDSQV